MPFVLSSKSAAWYRVEVDRTNDDTGTWNAQPLQFMGEYKRLSQPEIDELAKAKPAPSDDEICERYFLGWKEGDVKQPDGSPLERNPSNRVALLAEPGVRSAIVNAFLTYGIKGRIKN